MSANTNNVLKSTFTGRRVWLSGATGFKGSWLAQWLIEMGATVHGYALQPLTIPAMFDQLDLSKRITFQEGDVRDAMAVKHSILETQPDFVFHLAAQAIVRTSFEEPALTWATNVLGTVHVLEALRELQKQCCAVFVTSDKCYENKEWLHGYREEDNLGGYDPYSSSKAATEHAIASWRRSFFANHPVRIASARAGNVVGGGDWAKDRIIPDCIRALQQNEPINIRNKIATRPWQHVLDPLSGYLWLATCLDKPQLRPFDISHFTSAFNFGPNLSGNRSVADLVTEVLKHLPGSWEDKSDPNAVHEAKLLSLSIDKAFHLLGWKPVWEFEKAIQSTVNWYRIANDFKEGVSSLPDLMEFTSNQISEYQADAMRCGLTWATSMEI